MDGFTIFAMQKFTVMIHFNSFHFFGCSKENRFPIPNYITTEVNASSMILTELWQTGADLTHEIHYISSIHLLDSFAKFCKYIPFAKQTVSGDVVGTSNSCTDFQ